MTQLVSPGVQVNVIDESMYPSTGSGTVPLIFMATAEYKTHSSGTGFAQGSLPSFANQLMLMTSTRDLIQTFGVPTFYTDDQQNALNGYELNEYGLHAAYQYLSQSNTCYVIRAAIDLSELQPRELPPVGDPDDGTWWLDIGNTQWGVFASNGNAIPGLAWDNQDVIEVVNDTDISVTVINTVPVATPSTIISVDGGTLVINTMSVTIPTNATLQNVIDAINTGMPGLTASAFEMLSQNFLMIQNLQPGGQIDIQSSSTPLLLTEIGLVTATAWPAPNAIIGLDGQIAIVLKYSDNVIYQKIKPEGVFQASDTLSSSFWFAIGSPEWSKARPTKAIGSNMPTATTAGNQFVISNGTDSVTITLSGTTTTSAANDINSAISGLSNSSTLKSITAGTPNAGLVIADPLGGDILLSNLIGTPLAALGIATQRGHKLTYSPHYQVPANSTSGDVWIKTTQFNNGVLWVLNLFSQASETWTTYNPPLLANATAANVYYGTRISATSTYVQYNIYGTSTKPIASHEVLGWNGVQWLNITYTASTTSPTAMPADGTMWFSYEHQGLSADIMVSNGLQWVGYNNYAANTGVDQGGVLFEAARPKLQSTGTPLVTNDLWVDTSPNGIENFPIIYRYNAPAKTWTLIDDTDLTTPFGILFGDARWSANGLNDGPRDIVSMMNSDFCDPDAPDPRLYPDGFLLWNTRWGSANVKQYYSTFFKGEIQAHVASGTEGQDFTRNPYTIGDKQFPPLVDAGRWVSASGSRPNGEPNFGRKAQRALVVKALNAVINSNPDSRSETIFFNLITCPGYPDVMDELISLNTDRGETAFIIGDVPARLPSDSNSINNWANPDLSVNANAIGTGEDVLAPGTHNPYIGIWYPWGLSTNVDGSTVYIPSSTIALRIIAHSDQISYPWRAPAGFTRGLVTNASTVGYLQLDGTFKVALLNQGQRDTLYTNNINPIAYIPGRGLVAFGQKTLNPISSDLDRINNARLVNYLKYNFNIIAQPFLFEPNTGQTRDAVKSVFERFLMDLVATQGLYDFIVICDSSNNLPATIDQHQLWIDVAIQCVQDVEFIYIPLRLVPTGTDMQALYQPAQTFNG